MAAAPSGPSVHELMASGAIPGVGHGNIAAGGGAGGSVSPGIFPLEGKTTDISFGSLDTMQFPELNPFGPLNGEGGALGSTITDLGEKVFGHLFVDPARGGEYGIDQMFSEAKETEMTNIPKALQGDKGLSMKPSASAA